MSDAPADAGSSPAPAPAPAPSDESLVTSVPATTATTGGGGGGGGGGGVGGGGSETPAPAPTGALPPPTVRDVPDRDARKVAMLRLMSDWRRIREEAPPGVSASPIGEDNIFQWNASVVGPDETPWEGGIFSLRLQFPDQYPDRPPRVRFTCEMFHPNVYADGTLCLDIIQDMWKPIYTVDMLLTSIMSLLTDPNCDSPANPEAARLLRTNPKEYKKRVRRLAQKTVEG